MDYGIYDGALEIRQVGGKSVINGVFKYGDTAVIADRGRRRKERFSPRAFEFSINDAERKIDVLVGHDFGKPIASRQAGSLEIEDTAEAVLFEARLPNPSPSWVTDAEIAIDNGLMTGLSPGFVVPPRTVIANAEELIPEPGNPGIQIRQIHAAVLREMSVVTNNAYPQAGVELRSEDVLAIPAFDWRRLAWL